jgi:lipopolysaccharide/colanic/teichoic acid biosynthesis glycosyltransferase
MAPLVYSTKQAAALIGLDVVLVLVSTFLAAQLDTLHVGGKVALFSVWHTLLPYGLLLPAIFYWGGLYRESLAVRSRDEAYFVGVGFLLLMLIFLFLFPVWPWLQMIQPAVWAFVLIGFALVGTARCALHAKWAASRQTYPENTLVGKLVSFGWPTSLGVKRMLDVLLAGSALALTAPLMCLAAILVAVDSGPPIVFSQPRVGKCGRHFLLLKFRTLRVGSGTSWVRPGDSRMTRVGALLRRFSIDELPQLLNVLRGEMSLVGPRPEMVEFEQMFCETIPAYRYRRIVQPGLTGWAQINMKRNLQPDDVQEVIKYDLLYIAHWSIYLDLVILLKTAIEFPFHRAV